MPFHKVKSKGERVVDFPSTYIECRIEFVSLGEFFCCVICCTKNGFGPSLAEEDLKFWHLCVKLFGWNLLAEFSMSLRQSFYILRTVSAKYTCSSIVSPTDVSSLKQNSWLDGLLDLISLLV